MKKPAADSNRRARPSLQLIDFEQGRVRLTLKSSADVVRARKIAAQFATGLGFAAAEIAVIATVISEFTRGMINARKAADLSFTIVHDGLERGLEVIARQRPDAVDRTAAKTASARIMASQPAANSTVILKRWRTS